MWFFISRVLVLIFFPENDLLSLCQVLVLPGDLTRRALYSSSASD